MPLARETFRVEAGLMSSGELPAVVRCPEERSKDQSNKGKGKALKPDPSQPSVAAFFGKPKKMRDVIPSKCDEWDRTWDEGTEGLGFKSRLAKDDAPQLRVAVKAEGTSALSAERTFSEVAGSRGICKICSQEVTTFDPRVKDADGYLHAECDRETNEACKDASNSTAGRDCREEIDSSGEGMAADTVVVSSGQAESSREGSRKLSAFAGGGGARGEGGAASAATAAAADAKYALWLQQKEYAEGSERDVDSKTRRQAVAPDKAAGGAGRYGESRGRPQQSGLSRDESLAGILGPKYRDVWDSDHVRLPCSRLNVSFKDGSPRWLKIRHALSPAGGFHKVSDLITAITGYMGKPQKGQRWSFRALESLVDNWYDRKERQAFFEITLPFIIKSALALPSCCPHPIPLLRAGSSAVVNLSSLQIVSLLANAFLCTFPEARDQGSKHARKFPRINFCVLFEAPDKPWNRKSDPVAEHTQKILCILHYFQRQAERSIAELERSIVTFHRRSHDHGRDWAQSKTRMASMKLSTDVAGKIEDFEDADEDAWEADFANCLIGGGVLASGCVQEEIRFLLSPELITSLLLTERLGELEHLLITGSERFSTYTGYASTFQFSGNFVDNAGKDALLSAGEYPLQAAEYRRRTTVTAMDALHFAPSQYGSQFQIHAIRRELDKAFAAFQKEDMSTAKGGSWGTHLGMIDNSNASLVRTGNWGCGAFGGDLILKAVIQLVAAAEAGRNLKYFVFGDEELSEQIQELHGVLCDGDEGEGCTVGQIWRALEQFTLGKQHFAGKRGGQELRKFLVHYRWSEASPGLPGRTRVSPAASPERHDDDAVVVRESDDEGEERSPMEGGCGSKRGRSSSERRPQDAPGSCREVVLDSDSDEGPSKKQRTPP